MKYDELHILVKKNQWVQVRQTGSHIIYRNGFQTYPVPYPKGKEVGKGLEKRIKKEMKLK